MNEELNTYIQKAGADVSLTHEERERMRRTLHAYMEMKPLRSPIKDKEPYAPWNISWIFSSRPVAVVLVGALFASTAGVSYAAQSALPGDVLYPVKTRVNEPVAGALSVSADAKLAWAMSVAGERVKEAATLAAEGRLSSTTQAQLEANFEEHARNATEGITTQASSSPEASAEVAVRFSAQLSEYENVLTQIGAAQGTDVKRLAASVRAQQVRVDGVRARVQERVAAAATTNTPRSIARMHTAARQQLDVSIALSRAAEGSISTSSAQIVALQLKNASETISAASSTDGKRAAPQAFDTLQDVLSSTEKLGVFLKTSAAIHARTGRVVGEPSQSERPALAPGYGTATQDTVSKKKAKAVSMKADVSSTTEESPNMQRLSAPSATAGESSVAVHAGASSTVQAQSTGKEDERTDRSRARLPSLPISVPLGN